jgi:hypothetical protein
VHRSSAKRAAGEKEAYAWQTIFSVKFPEKKQGKKVVYTILPVSLTNGRPVSLFWLLRSRFLQAMV